MRIENVITRSYLIMSSSASERPFWFEKIYYYTIYYIS